MKNAKDKAKETTWLTLYWREMFFFLSRARKKITVLSRNRTSEFFVYFSILYVHDETNTSPFSLPERNSLKKIRMKGNVIQYLIIWIFHNFHTTHSTFMNPSIITYLSPLQYVFVECFLFQSVFPFWSSSSSFFSQVQASRHELNLWYR